MAIAQPLGQHWTFGHQAVLPIVPPTPPPPPPPVPTPINFPIVPAIAICVIFGVVAIAAAVALSLIPIYTPRRTYNVSCSSDSMPATFNINQDTLPLGALSSSNNAALQAGLTQQIAQQPGFSHCHAEVHNPTVDPCSSGQRLLTRRKRHEDAAFKSRYVRQTTDNCQSQQLNTAVSLNCNCTCVGVCLRRKLLLLNNILSTLTATITFAGPTPVVVIITGPRVPTGSFTNRPTTVTTATTATNTTATTAVSSTTTPSRAPSTTTTAMVTANFLG